MARVSRFGLTATLLLGGAGTVHAQALPEVRPPTMRVTVSNSDSLASRATVPAPMRGATRLHPSNLVPASAPAPTHAIWVTTRRWGLAIPGMMAGNIIPMIFNEAWQEWKDISRTSPYTWRLYGFWYEWDDNHFFNNQIFHPIQGSFYYNAGRANGFNYWESFLFTAAGSLLWECCGERRPGSKNDLLNTTFGGAALGEMLFRATSLYIDNTITGIDRFARELLVWPLNGERGLARAVYGDYDEPNPNGRRPPRWGLGMRMGWRWLDGLTHPFGHLELRYGDVAGPAIHAPFDYFVFRFALNGEHQPIGQAQVEAHLFQRIWLGAPLEGQAPGGILKVFGAHNYDYLDSTPDVEASLQQPQRREEGYRYGGHSLGLGLAGVKRWSSAELAGSVQGEFTPIGAVNSNYEPGTTGAYAERQREYDFGIGGGGRARLGAAFWIAKVDAAYARQHLNVRHGSNLCQQGPSIVRCDDPTHVIQTASASVQLELDAILGFITRTQVKWAEHWWLGGDVFGFRKDSRYQTGVTHHKSVQWRVFLSWDWTVWNGQRVRGVV